MALLIPTLFRKMMAEIPSCLGRKMGSRILIKILLLFLLVFNSNFVKTRRTVERTTVLNS